MLVMAIRNAKIVLPDPLPLVQQIVYILVTHMCAHLVQPVRIRIWMKRQVVLTAQQATILILVQLNAPPAHLVAYQLQHLQVAKLHVPRDKGSKTHPALILNQMNRAEIAHPATIIMETASIAQHVLPALFRRLMLQVVHQRVQLAPGWNQRAILLPHKAKVRIHVVIVTSDMPTTEAPFIAHHAALEWLQRQSDHLRAHYVQQALESTMLTAQVLQLVHSSVQHALKAIFKVETPFIAQLARLDRFPMVKELSIVQVLARPEKGFILTAARYQPACKYAAIARWVIITVQM